MSDRLRKLRKEKGLKQEEAAKGMFMSRTTLSKYENPDTDTDSMPARELLRLARFYNCDPRYLTGDIPCKDKEVSDIHWATGLSEEAINSLMHRRAEALKYGYSFSSEDYFLVADLVSCLITNIDDDLLIQFVRASARSEMYKQLIADMKANKRMAEDATHLDNETVLNGEFYILSARNTKTDIAEQFKRILDEWMKGRLNKDVNMLLAEVDYDRK